MLSITKNADVKMSELIKQQSAPTALRIAVVGGGCSGFQYDMGFDTARDTDETHLTDQGVSILIDPLSYRYLDGVTIDFVESLQGAGFTFDNPNASRTCGCGKSFSA